jgi:hypothetical protein
MKMPPRLRPKTDGEAKPRQLGNGPREAPGHATRQQNALKHGRYTREAVEERRQLRALLRQSRMLIQQIE